MNKLIIKDLDGSYCCLIETLSRYFSGEIKKNHEELMKVDVSAETQAKHLANMSEILNQV
jgi:hypothetical protein